MPPERVCEKIWKDHYRKVLYFVRCVMGVGRDAEDLVQEIFGKAFGKFDTYDSRYSVSTWIYRIARNRCIDYLRRARPGAEALDEETALSADAGPEGAALSAELDAAVGRFLAGKDETARSIVYFRFYERMTVGEIAEALAIPAGTVKSRLYALKAELRKALEDYR